ncbi:MAG: hypothetical protein J5902_00990 [Paludibacteraceae bacterium]|nr:hypothetical protein [Paludibacteraceae bacterium]
MKKFLYLAMMALTLGFFAGCTGASVGKQPVIDENAGTVNGKAYDTETYKCWEFTWEYTEKATGEADAHESGVDYFWMTEFEIQKYKAEWDYAHNASASAYGVKYSISGESSLKETDKDVSECYDE